MTKAFTDLEQSKKLEKVLSSGSADMCWVKIYDENHMMSEYRAELIPFRLCGVGVPCWSLAALSVELVPYTTITKLENTWVCESMLDRCEAENPVDACVDMILKLHEKKLL